MDFIINLLEAVPAWLVAITGLVTAASAVTALTPSKTDDAIVSKILSFLHLVALNVGNAKPASKEDKE